MGNKVSNSKTINEELVRKVSNSEDFIQYGNLTKTNVKCQYNNNVGDFLKMNDDPRNWTPNDLTPSKVMLLTSGSQFHSPVPPPPTKRSTPSDTLRIYQMRTTTNTSLSTAGNNSKIGDWDRLIMTPFKFPRSRGNYNQGEGEHLSMNTSKLTIRLIDKKLSSSNHLHHFNPSKLDQGENINYKRSSTSTINRHLKPPWYPDVRTSAAKTNLVNKNKKSSIFSLIKNRKSSKLKRKSTSSLSKLKYNLKSYKVNSQIKLFKKSLINSSKSENSYTNSPSPPETTDIGGDDESKSKINIVMMKRPPSRDRFDSSPINRRKKSTFSIKSSLSNAYSNDYTDTYDYSYSYTYSNNPSPTNKKIANLKKEDTKKKLKPGGSSGSSGNASGSGAGGTSASSKSTSEGKSTGKASTSGAQSYSDTRNKPGKGPGGGRPPLKKKIPPPPVFIGSYGESNTKKKDETPADRLKNVDIVEELCYNCPDNCDGGDNECNCTLDYYCCCNECGEMELVPHCSCKPKPKSGNPVKYCRRQRFNFDDGKKNDECEDGPPFSWEDRSPNPYDEIPVGKNPVMGISNGSDGCCDPSQNSDKHCSTDNNQVLPSESGTYFFDAERRCFVPVVEIREPPPPPPPEVVDEIIDEEPILTNLEPIIQPVIQPMGGMCGCGPCGMPYGMPGMGCGMPFFGAMGGGMCFDGPGNDCGKKSKGKYKGSSEDKSSNGNTMDNLGMMGLCGMNMNGLANMGPYGSVAMPVMKYNMKPPTPPPCPVPQCCPQCPCCPNPCQAPCQPMTNCCNPICFPGYPSCPYPMYCNPCGKGKKDKKKGKKKHRNSGDNNSSVQTSTTADASTGASDSTPSGSKDDGDYDEDD